MKTKIIYSLAILLLTMSCSKDFLNVKQENNPDSEVYFNSAGGVTQAVNSIYVTFLHKGMYPRDYYYIFDLLGNDAVGTAKLQGTLNDFVDYSYGPTNPEITSLYSALSKMVFRSNFAFTVLDKWTATTDEEVALKNRLIGEASFFKAYAYFSLITYFGDVPYKADSEAHNLLHQERTSKVEILDHIKFYLKEAEEKLPVSYPASDYGRSTKGAAIALLGKVHLYNENWADAKTEFTKLSTAEFNYDLNTDLDDLFAYDVNDSDPANESVFAVMHARWNEVAAEWYIFVGAELNGGEATHSGREHEYGFKGYHNAELSDDLVAAFTYNVNGSEEIDPRASKTFYSKSGIAGGDSNYVDGDFTLDGFDWRKYTRYEHNVYANISSNINSQIIRYADVLLMLAEANIKLGDNVAALDLINQVRLRSGAIKYTDIGSDPMQTLRRERRLEFAGEQIRFPDLVRWGMLESTINAEKGEEIVFPKHNLLPIPQIELDTNPATKVLDGWN